MKNQLLRLIKFVAELKKKTYPNTNSFAKKLQRMDLDENINISCSPRTILRDIDYLKEYFNAPIEYDPAEKGYFLYCDWTFKCPVNEKKLLISSLLSARIAEQFIPAPIKEEINESAESMIASSSEDLFDARYFQTLIIATDTKVTINPLVFKIVFDAWRNYRVIRFNYRKSSGAYSTRTFEPHILAEHNGAWYLKGFDKKNDICNDKKGVVFAIHRIVDAEILEESFLQDKALLKDTEANGLFNYVLLKNIKVQCSSTIAGYLKEQSTAKGFNYKQKSNGDLIVLFPEAYEYEITRWVLGEGANVKVLEPQSFVEKIKAEVDLMMNLYFNKNQETAF
ncbi:MAG: WYL domain-containing protein [Verrucomicrobiota bacterium]|nr:WYL domain-containing protein [Verrucomicrobiota bacterium]